ncbi:MAG TPA: hypothetical protein VK705_00505 [Ferruginibacter sp.]|jgi:hypothetical protein|nr:hypothetical protein [Ferruginibacter sp.]
MKKLLQLFLFLFILLIGIASCKKTNNSSPGSNTIHLKEFLQLDTTKQAPYDTMEIDTYGYDNLNRPTTSASITFSPDFPGIADSGTSSNSIFYYTGSSTTLGFGITNDYDRFGSGGNDTDYTLAYSGISKDSDISDGNPAIVTEDFVSGATVIEKTTDYSYSPAQLSYDTVTQTIVNGNVVAQVDDQIYNQTNFTVSLDTHPNPFYFGNGSQNEGVLSTGDNNIMEEPQQKNNNTELYSTTPGGPMHLKYQYTYNANGYPATVIEYDLSSGSPVFVYKGIYVY